MNNVTRCVQFSPSKRLLPVRVRFIAVLGCVFATVPFGWANEPPETYQQILARRSPPRLDTLIERSAPDQLGEIVSASFLDLLKLRDQPLDDAVPVIALAEILAMHADSSRWR